MDCGRVDLDGLDCSCLADAGGVVMVFGLAHGERGFFLKG